MASIRKIAQYVLEDARDGIAWIALWKNGRSWEAETFYTDYNSDNMDSFDSDALGRFREIVAIDPRAILVNGYYCNLGDTTCMNRDSLANALRWQYGLENPFLLANELECQEEEEETTQEEMVAVRVKVYDGSKYENESKKIADVDYMVKGFEVKKIPPDEILKEFDETDEYDEYLILALADGETATFRNSHVDLFKL